MRRVTDWTSGVAVGIALTLALTVVPSYHFEQAPGRSQRIALQAPRPTPHAELGPGTPSMTTEPPLPSPDVEGSAGLPDGPEPLVASPSPTGTRPAPTATPRTATPPRQPLAGLATWYRGTAGEAAAGPALRAALGPGWRGTRVTVSGPAGTARTVLGDFMRADKLIDLHAPLFTAVCGPLSKGVCRVVVRW